MKVSQNMSFKALPLAAITLAVAPVSFGAFNMYNPNYWRMGYNDKCDIWISYRNGNTGTAYEVEPGQNSPLDGMSSGFEDDLWFWPDEDDEMRLIIIKPTDYNDSWPEC